MTTTLLLATKNAGKIREFRALFWDLPKLIVKPADEVLAIPDIDEDGRTFEENAAKKAREIARVTGHLVLADDSGLEVDALGGRPGVYSARYAGRHGDDEGNNDKLLLELAGIADDKRGARYRVVLALADPRGPLGEDVHLETGVCEGTILRVRRGRNGFGYDPVFAPKAFDKTMAELSAEEKNEISHRAEAASKMRKFLGDYLAQRAAARVEAGMPASNGAAHAASAAQPTAAKPARPAAAESQVTPVAAPAASAAGTERSAETPASPAPAPSASKPKTGQRTAAAKSEDAAGRTPREKPAKADPKQAPAAASGDDAGKPSPTRRGKPRVA